MSMLPLLLSGVALALPPGPDEEVANGYGTIGTTVVVADLDADGFADVVTGGDLSAGWYRGSAGGLASTPATSWDVRLQGYSTGAAAGDFDGDGYVDLALAVAASSAGAAGVVVYPGAAGGPSAAAWPTWSIPADSGGVAMVTLLSTAGDVDGDGDDDLLATNEYGYAAAALAYDGGSLAVTTLWQGEGDIYPEIARGIGDIDGDGLADVAIGESFSSRVDVFRGDPAGLATMPDVVLTGTSDYLGTDLAGPGDVDGDGYADLAVGAPLTGGASGAIYWYAGGPSGLGSTPTWSESAPSCAHTLGWGVEAAGDVDADGFADTLTGASYTCGDEYAHAEIELWFGSPDGPGSTPWRVHGESMLGGGMDGGDVDGDGASDVVAYSNSGDGELWLFFGRATASGPDDTGDPAVDTGDPAVDTGDAPADSGDPAGPTAGDPPDTGTSTDGTKGSGGCGCDAGGTGGGGLGLVALLLVLRRRSTSA